LFEGRRKREKGRRKREEGRGKREEGRGKINKKEAMFRERLTKKILYLISF